MHELSIVEALIDQVGNELDRAGQPGRVARLELSIGRLSGVNCESIRFAFRLLAAGTLVESAEIVIQEPKAVCHCRACGAQAEIDDLVVQCPGCARHATTVAIDEAGREPCWMLRKPARLI